jgi:choice-of-anchor A domain-containing protein
LATKRQLNKYLAVVIALATVVPMRAGLAQTGGDVAQALGFETTSAWQLTGGSGTLSSVAALSQGTHALEVSGGGWRRLRSNALAVGASGASLKIDFVARSALAGWETLGIVLEIPSAGFYWQDLGNSSLSGLPSGEVRSFEFSLPAEIRSAFAANHAVNINVVFNGPQTFSVDRLDLGLTTPPPPTPPPPSTSSSRCNHRDLEVVNVQADFRDIWAGRETVATGKRTDSFPTITLEFNQAVETQRLSARVVGLTAGSDSAPSDCVDANGNPIAATALHDARFLGEAGANAWRLGLGDVAQSAPLDFNIVAFSNVNGIPDAQGAIMAGGDVTLQNFSVNQVAHRPIGVVVQGALRATNGTIRGDVARGATAPQFQSVTLTGVQRTDVPLAFGELEQRLGAMSQALSGFATTGTAQLTSTQLTFAGTHPSLNVFTLEASTLSQARSIVFSTPTGSASLVNVRGTSVTIQNTQISLGSTPRSSTLWNLPQATRFELASVSFQGSALAPLADAIVNNGNFEGTLVARSVRGNMEFHDFPLTSWQSFGGSALTSTVVLRPEGRLRAGCEYHLIVDPFPATPDGGCLSTSFLQPFLVNEGQKTAFDREVTARRFARRPNVPEFFAAKEGINTPIDEVFDRYLGSLSLRKGVDELLPVGISVASPLHPAREIQRFRQVFHGVPVEGYGYLVAHENGIFRSAVGQLLPAIDEAITAAVSEQQALDTAIAFVAPAVRPWEANPPTGSAPQAELLLRPLSHDPAAPDLRLVFRVHFSGIEESDYVDVDATTGAVVHNQQRRRFVESCEGFIPSFATINRHEMRSRTVPFNNMNNVPRTDLSMGIWNQGSTTYEAFNNTAPFSHRTRFQVAQPTDPTSLRSTEFVCAGVDLDTARVAWAHWAVQNAHDTFFDLVGWQGLRGPGAGGSVRVSVLDVPPNAGFRTWFSRATLLPDPDDIQVLTAMLFPDVIAHEFGHGVSLYSRQELNLPTREYRAESGALEEAYGDIAGVLALHHAVADGSVDPFCLTLFGEPCDVNLADPKNSGSRSFPDTYLGEHFETIEPDCHDGNDLCGIHTNTTVAGHWFFTLVNGRDASDENDLGCAASVAPLQPDFQSSLLDAGMLVFESFRMTEASAGFLATRLVTAQVADALLGPEARLAVEKAWHAVGVGEGPTPLDFHPEDGSTDVEPWSTEFRFTVADDDTGPWTLRYSKDPDFTSSTVVSVTGTQIIDSVRYARVFVSLDAGTKYYWQAREGDEDTELVGWDICSTFTASFTTSEKPIQVVTPAGVTSEGYYLTNNMGQFGWEPVPRATGYHALLSETNDGCSRPTSEWTEVTLNLHRIRFPGVFLGDTIDQNITLSRDPIRLSPDLVLDPDKTYHLFVRAVNGGNLAGCNHFEVRKLKLMPFQKLSPLDFVTIPYHSGGPFVWTPSEGADHYQLVVRRWPPGEPLETVTRETIDAASVVLNADGNVEHTLGDTSATTLPGQMVWEVEAIHATGDHRLGWDPGVPGFSSDANFWSGAQQLTEAQTENGEHGPIQDGLVVPVTLVFPREQLERDTQTCFKVPGNTFGLWWWFGSPNVSEIPFDEIVDVHVDPASTEEFSICTTRLDLSGDEDKVLVVMPYSNFVHDNPQGSFGPQTIFRMHVAFCGGVGDACCEGSQCVDGALCAGGTCESCGAKNEPCCDGDVCDTRALTCDGGECVFCGDTAQKCCLHSEPPCETGLSCDDREVCVNCGLIGKNCCLGGTPCAQGACNDQNICEESKRCNSIVAAGANAAESFSIEMGKREGRVTLRWNSFTVPDNIFVSYEGSVIMRSGCYGTHTAPLGCAPDPFNPTTMVCCNGMGNCSITFGYGPGQSTKLDVLVEPNCFQTPDTEWNFTLSCPN